MPIQIIKSDRRKQEKIAGRYMQEIREIVRARLSRRKLLKMGLVMGGGSLLALEGMRSFRPYWAHAEGLTLISPPNTPFLDPLPILPALQETRLNPRPAKRTNPSPSSKVKPFVEKFVKETVNRFPEFKGFYDAYLSQLDFAFTEAPRPDHQRWTEFGGKSDTDPGFEGPQYELIQMPVVHDFYPAIDGVLPYLIWTFVDATSGNVGPLMIQARYGEPIVVRIHNALPEDNRGYGINQASTHLHNGHTASESDGGPTHFYEAGQFKDYHYPNVRAGFSLTHPFTTLKGKTVAGDVRETLSTLWFHDHRFDFTSQNVYKGLAGFYLLFSEDIDLDAGDETKGLRLPSGEFDIPMIFADKVFDPTTGEMFFDLFNLDGILGDKYTVNGKIQPFLEVKRRGSIPKK